MAKRNSESSVHGTYFQIDSKLHGDFKPWLTANDQTLRSFVEKRMREALENKSPYHHQLNPSDTLSEKQLAGLLANSVANILQRDQSWAHELIKTAQLRLPGGILRHRMAHYLEEKVFLSRQFSVWLTNRIAFALDSGQHVYLLVDAGSSNLWLCQYLWEPLSVLSQKRRSETLTLITTNMAVGEAFGQQSQQGNFSTNTKITCEIVGGEVDPHYGALTGSKAEENLKQSTDHRTKKGKGLFVALPAGNFIRLNADPTYAVPLVRGDGQLGLKKLYVERSDESYLLAPLGKIFVSPTSDLNEAFGLESNATAHKNKAYEEVRLNVEMQKKIKLVTTLRSNENALLYQHSKRIGKLLNGVSLRDTPTATDYAPRHFSYTFDEHIENKNRKDQIAIECPHEDTRHEKFLKGFYGVDSPARGHSA